MRPLPTPAPPPAEIERLLAPVSEGSPAGDWLRFDAVYDEVRKLREEDDPNLPQNRDLGAPQPTN